MMTSCYNVGQLRPLALCIQGLPLGYRSVSLLAKGEAEGMIYVTRSSLKVGLKLLPLRVMVANHHGRKDTRSGSARYNPMTAGGTRPTTAFSHTPKRVAFPFDIIGLVSVPCPLPLIPSPCLMPPPDNPQIQHQQQAQHSPPIIAENQRSQHLLFPFLL